MSGSVLEIRGERRTGKSFTALLNILGRAMVGVKGKVLMIGTSRNNVKDHFINMKRLCKMFNVKYEANIKHFIIKINNLELYFDTEMKPGKNYCIIVSDTSNNTVLIEDK